MFVRFEQLANIYDILVTLLVEKPLTSMLVSAEQPANICSNVVA